MKSLRLDPELEDQLDRAARIEGVSESEFIRRAVRRACEETLSESLADQLKDFIGAVKGGPDNLSEETGRKFTEQLVGKQRRGRA